MVKNTIILSCCLASLLVISAIPANAGELRESQSQGICKDAQNTFEVSCLEEFKSKDSEALSRCFNDAESGYSTCQSEIEKLPELISTVIAGEE